MAPGGRPGGPFPGTTPSAAVLAGDLAGGLPAGAREAAAHVFVTDVDAPALEVEDRRHLLGVLRLRVGEALSVADGAGRWRRCTLGPEGRLDPAGNPVPIPLPAPAITVALAVPKADRPTWAVQKLTEVGVERIVLVTTARCVVRWDGERAAHHLRRLRTVARAAAMQSRRARIPLVDGPMSLAELVATMPSTGPVAGSGSGPIRGPLGLAEPGGEPPSLDCPGVVIGPEGGWSPEELAVDLPRVGLGPGVLRTETAAVVAGAILVALRAGVVAPASRPGG